MTVLDRLIYNPERLACTVEEKDACLETVRKLARLCKFFRRNGLLAAYDLAEKEDDPFLSACLFEFGEGAGDDNEMERLERVFCAYLAAGNYRGGSFLNAVLVVKGLLLMSAHSDVPPSAWGQLLSAELRGFFGAEYRERVMDVIEQETKRPNTRESSFIPEFDRFVPLDLPQRQALLRKADARDLALALPGASAAVEKALLEALTGEARKMLEKEYLPYTHNLRVIDVTQAQEALLKQWGLVKPEEVLEPSIPDTDCIFV